MPGGNNKLTIAKVKERTPKVLPDFECISEKYECSTGILKFKCPKGHIFSTSWTTFSFNKKGCPICRKEFCGVDSKGINRIYKDKNWLYDQYVNQLKSTNNIAKFCGVGHRLILSWLYKYNIPVRSSSLSTTIGQCKNTEVKKKIINFKPGNNQKLCTSCGHTLDLSNFRKNSTTKDGYQAFCNMCMSQYDYSDSEYSKYRNEIDYLTNVNFRKFYYFINPNKYPRDYKNYQLDHIYSVHDGFINNVNKEIISSPVNLRIVSSMYNSTKNSRSDIGLNMLYFLHSAFIRSV